MQRNRVNERLRASDQRRGGRCSCALQQLFVAVNLRVHAQCLYGEDEFVIGVGYHTGSEFGRSAHVAALSLAGREYTRGGRCYDGRGRDAGDESEVCGIEGRGRGGGTMCVRTRDVMC